MLEPAAATPGDDVFQRAPRRSYAGWVLLLLLMSVAAFGAMHKDWVLEEAELFKKYLLRGTPAVAAPDEAASAAAAAASVASAEALAAAELAASVAADAARVASQADELASAASAAVAPAVIEPVLVASADKERKADTTDVKPQTKVEANSDEAWVKQLPAGGYVVQLAAMDTQDDMRSFQRSNAVYAKARIMRARQKDSGKRYYILVAGPFDTKAQADAFMQSSPLLSKGWLRSTKSMAAQFIKS
jgi:septal ring-binding cell division protein DamX